MDQTTHRENKKAGKASESVLVAGATKTALMETATASRSPIEAMQLPAPLKTMQTLKELRMRKMGTVNNPQRISPSMDRLLHTQLGRLTGNISPAALALAYLDWAVHLSISPAKIMELARFAAAERLRLRFYANKARFGVEEPDSLGAQTTDSNFSSQYWDMYPFNIMRESFLTLQRWWDEASTDVRGMSAHHEDVINFCVRQMLNTSSPANNPFWNPDILRTTYEQGGANLVRGAFKFNRDMERWLTGLPPIREGNYHLGENIACTKGKVIYRNRLIELLQYEPMTEKVRPEPILFVPAWVQKYYILDLSQQNSLVQHLLKSGFTVFMISWKNPGPEERDIGWDGYVNLGVRAALGVITTLCPNVKVHTASYCLGGTLLAISAATLAREQSDLLKSVSTLCAQTDFEEAGELMLFIDDSQVAFLEDILWDQGYLDSSMMAGVFQLLRANDLIWNRILRAYFYGEDEKPSDLNVWSQDPTRMPAQLQSEYMSSLYLRNDLSRGRFKVGGRPVSLSDIRAPMYVLATDLDHISPWKSVFKILQVADTSIDFVLGTGGHNSGLVNPPAKGRGYFQASHHRPDDPYIDPDTWHTLTPKTSGSWWTHWSNWIEKQSDQRWVEPPSMGSAVYPALMDAPGSYVMIR